MHLKAHCILKVFSHFHSLWPTWQYFSYASLEPITSLWHTAIVVSLLTFLTWIIFIESSCFGRKKTFFLTWLSWITMQFLKWAVSPHWRGYRLHFKGALHPDFLSKSVQWCNVRMLEIFWKCKVENFSNFLQKTLCCRKECQMAHWKVHKKEVTSLKKQKIFCRLVLCMIIPFCMKWYWNAFNQNFSRC